MELREIVELTKSLIEFHTTADDHLALKSCAHFLTNFFSGIPFSVQQMEHKGIPSLVFTAKGVKKPKVFLNAHFDVVGSDGDHFKPSVDKGRLYGRGSYDMKAALAVMCCLMRDLAKKNPIEDNVGLMLVGDEETGGFNGSKYLLEQGYKPQCVVIGEPTNLDIEYRAKGVLWLKISSQGRSAHSAYPWKGDNAIVKLLDVLAKVRKAFPIPKEEAWTTTCNIGKISGGDVANKVPDHAEAILDLRYVPEEDPKECYEHVRRLGEDFELEVLAEEPPVVADPKDVYAQKLKSAAETVLGREVRFVSGHGASDGRFFAAQGVSALVMGPIGGGQHARDEWVNVDSLGRYYEILEKFIQNLPEKCAHEVSTELG